jgi:hypothetical protein
MMWIVKIGALIISNDDTAHNVISFWMTSEELGASLELIKYHLPGCFL